MDVEEVDCERDARRYAPNYYLLDTCALLWIVNEPERLSKPAAAIWRTRRNTLVAVSVISYWEIAIKERKHGIEDVARWWEQRMMPYIDMEPIPVREKHITEMALLPHLHRDPFDRMLIAQARVENMLLVTADKQIREYDVRTVW
jgi:PIN domain nuclease of toxin-antitoxin system